MEDRWNTDTERRDMTVWLFDGGVLRANGNDKGRQVLLDTDRPARNADGGIRHRGQRGVEPGARHGRERHRGDRQQGDDTVPVPGAVL